MRSRAITFVVGVAFGAAVVLGLDRGDAQRSSAVVEQSVHIQNQTTSAGNNNVNTASADGEESENLEIPFNEQAPQADYPAASGAASVYVDMFGPPIEKVTHHDLHATFLQEPRHDAWAFDVENAIAQKVVDLEIARYAVIEHIECRAMTCEIAGYYTVDRENRPPIHLIQNIDRAIWFHDNMSSRTYNANPDGFDRFLTIGTARTIPQRTRDPRPLD